MMPSRTISNELETERYRLHQAYHADNRLYWYGCYPRGPHANQWYRLNAPLTNEQEAAEEIMDWEYLHWLRG